MNFEFSTKLYSGRPYQQVPEEYKAYCLIEPEKQAYKVRILKNVLLRKLCLKFLEDIKKNSYLSAVCTNFVEIWLWDIWSIHVLILQSSSKSVEQSMIFRTSIWWPQHFKNTLFCKFLTQFDPISEPLIAFLRAASEINNTDTLKVCKKITKITDPNLGFFVSTGRIRGWNLQQNFKNRRFKSTLVNINCFLSIIITKKNYWF